MGQRRQSGHAQKQAAGESAHPPRGWPPIRPADSAQARWVTNCGALLLSALWLGVGCAKTECPPSDPAPALTPGEKEHAPPPRQETLVRNPSAPRDAPSRAPTITRAQATPEQLAELNTWAEKNQLQQDLATFTTLGLPVSSEAQVHLEIQYNRREAPDSATVTVVQDHYLDDSLEGERFTLRFARKDCTGGCPGGPPWTLFQLSAERRCKPGRGHQDYSGDPCL